MKLFGVVGRPVSHSQSPSVFRHFLRNAGMEAEYLRISAPEFTSLIQIIKDGTLVLQGLNVTAPFKHDAYLCCDERSPEADLVKACNSIRFENGKMIGDNTDVKALRKIIGEIGAREKEKLKILILGAGKAAEAAIAASQLSGNVRNIAVWNRSKDRLISLIERYNITPLYQEAETIDWSCFDLIVNALPVYLEPLLSAGLHENQYLLDATYKDAVVARYFSETAVVKYIPGNVWLEEQARLSFCFFTGIRDDSEIACKRDMVRKDKPTVLIGLSGSGKSTIAESWAKTKNLGWVDLDAEIEKTAGMSIPEMFSAKGEGFFRGLELKALKNLADKTGIVVSAGAGVVTQPECRDILRSSFYPVWILSSIESIKGRLASGAVRPLLVPDFDARIRMQIDSRFFHYASLSELVVINSGESIEPVLDLLAKEID